MTLKGLQGSFDAALAVLLWGIAALVFVTTIRVIADAFI